MNVKIDYEEVIQVLTEHVKEKMIATNLTPVEESHIFNITDEEGTTVIYDTVEFSLDFDG